MDEFDDATGLLMDDPSLETFQATHDLDEKCMKSLIELPQGDQVVIMDIVNNKETKNASAFTWSVVRKMKVFPGRMKLEYLRKHVDERALEGLDKLPAPMQEQVAAGVDIASSRNLSAVVWKKIRVVQQGGQFGGNSELTMQQMQQMHQQMQQQMAQMQRAFLQQATALQQAQAQQPLMHSVSQRARDRSRSPRGTRGASFNQSPALRNLQVPPPVAAQSTQAHAQPRGGTQPVDDVLGWLRANGVDGRAQEAISSLDPSEQQMVIALVQRKPCRNISAVVWSMVKLAREKPNEAKLEYCRTVLDSTALASLESLPLPQQDAVLSKVDFANCRNLSAMVWSRVKAQGAQSLSRLGGISLPPPPTHGMMQGQMFSAPLAGATGASMLGGCFGSGRGDEILAELDDRCLEKFRELRQEQQLDILESVPANCRNVSAFVWSKVKLVM